MPTRLSTAEILAAARAADGKRSAAKPAPSPNRKPEAPSEQEPNASAAETPTVTAPSGAAPPVAVAASESTQPPAISGMLQQVRQNRSPESPAAPTPVRGLLDAVRNNGRTEVRPASMTAILQKVREICGTSPARPASTGNNAVSTAAKKSSAAEILAAARQNAKPTPATGGSTPPAKSNSTADILAAARRQGAAKEAGVARANTEPKPQRLADASKSPQPAKVAGDLADDGRPRPPAMARLLDSVRSSTLERQAGIEYPTLPEMLIELRRLDRRSFRHARDQRSGNGLIARIKQWLSGQHKTHQGASI